MLLHSQHNRRANSSLPDSRLDIASHLYSQLSAPCFTKTAINAIFFKAWLFLTALNQSICQYVKQIPGIWFLLLTRSTGFPHVNTNAGVLLENTVSIAMVTHSRGWTVMDWCHWVDSWPGCLHYCTQSCKSRVMLPVCAIRLRAIMVGMCFQRGG